MNDKEQADITITKLIKEIQHLQIQLNIKNNEITSLQADLAMANDRIKYLTNNY